MDQERKDAAALAAGYSQGHRVYELVGIALTTSATIWLVVRLTRSTHLSGWWLPLAALIGILFADFISGFVHWMFDTWGAVDTPVVGKLAIRTFRHHHVDAKAITRHDFVETNGHNITLALLPAVSGVVYVGPGESSQFHVFWGATAVFAVVFVSFTSQIHKWAHQDVPSRFVQLLQRARLVLSPEHHDVHHAAPHTRNYCITVGWMNGPLRTVRFFETLERVISALTGAIPREDDLGPEAALDAAPVLESETTTEEVLPARD